MKVSIITVVYNNASYIEDCIKSIVGQSYNNIEYILIDNESKDGTQDIINRYRDRIAKIIFEKDKGHIYAMNKGIGLATGDIVGFLHSDDIYMDSSVIESVVKVFKDNCVDCVYGDLIYVKKDNTNKIVRYWKGGSYNREKIKKGWMPPHPTFFLRRQVYEKYGLFDTTFKISMDYEIVLRFLYRHNISAAYLPDILVKMRSGGVSNGSIKNILIKTAEDYRAAKSYGLGIPTIVMKNIGKIPQYFYTYKDIR